MHDTVKYIGNGPTLYCGLLKPTYRLTQVTVECKSSAKCQNYILLRRNLLHACPMASMHDAHIGSNSTGFPHKFGNCLNKHSFKFCSSTIGNPRRSLHPITVHCAMTSSPKKESRANFTAKVGALWMADKLIYLASTAAADDNLAELITEDG